MKRIRNVIRYFIIILLNVVVMYQFHSYINLLFLVGLVLFPLYSFYGVHKVKQVLKMRIEVPVEPMERGNEFYVKIILHNPSFFPLVNSTLSLQIENRFYGEIGMHSLNVPIRAGKDTEVTYPISMEYCGRFVITASSIRLVDLLGIYEVDVPVNVEKECLVFPVGEERNQEAGQLYVKGVMESMESKEKGYDFSEISGIREYIPGDRLQNIHWKLSMKKDELMVKERISVSAMQLNVLVEMVNDEDMCLEAILDLADSITKAFVSQNLPFTAFYYSTNQGQLKDFYIGNEVERSQWMELLLYDRSYRENGKAEDMFIRENPAGGTYLYIGTGMTTDNTENMICGKKQAVAELRNY